MGLHNMGISAEIVGPETPANIELEMRFHVYNTFVLVNICIYVIPISCIVDT